MTSAIRYAQYVTMRANLREPAKYVWYWLTHVRKHHWLDARDQVTTEERLWKAVPGIGWLRFRLAYDESHDAWDSGNIKHEWRERETADPIRTGKSLGNDWYALNHFDHNRFLAVSFPGGGDYVGRRAYYSSTGMSKSDADLRARQAIRSECEYWLEVATGNVTFVGWLVTLLDNDESEINEDSCWGYQINDADDHKDIRECMEDAADSLVEEAFEKRHKLKYTQDMADAAMRAWHAAMASSDDDREIADPVFIATARSKACQKSLCL